MELWFCEDCGLRVSEKELSQGAIRDTQAFKTYCKACASKRAPVQTVEVNAPTTRKSGGTEIRARTTSSKLPAVPTERAPASSQRLSSVPTGPGSSNRLPSVVRATPQSSRLNLPAVRNKTDPQANRPATTRAPQPLPTAAIVGGAIGIGALVGGLTLMLLGGGSKPASAQPAPADKPVERAIARTEDPRPTPAPTTPVKPNPAPAPAVVIPPRDDEESRAATAFEAMKKRVEGELKDNKDGQLAAIDEYLGKYGETIAATRARILKDEIQNPKPRAQAKAPAQTPANVPKLTDAQKKDLVDRTGDMLRSGDAAGCMAECDKVLSQHPDFAELYVNRAAAHRMLGEFEEMLPDLDMAEKHHYALWQVAALRAVVYYAMHKDRDAMAQLNKAKSLMTEPAKLQSTWAAEVVRDRAIYDGKQLEGKSISNAQEYVARGIYRLIVKKYDEGSSDLEAALKVDVKTAPAVFTALASSALGRKDWKARLDAYRRWSEATPDSPEALNSYAWELLTSEDTSLRDAKAALPAAEKSNKLCGEKNWGVLDTLALAQFRNGNIQEAVDLEKKAIGLLPAETAAATRKEYNDHLAEFEAGLKSIK